MNRKPALTVWLDTRRKKTGKVYPVKIRITHNRERYYYPTNINLSEEDFYKATGTAPGMKLKEAHFRLQQLEQTAKETIDKIVDELGVPFSIDLFEKYLNINADDSKNVFHSFRQKIAALKENGQYKTSESYESALMSFSAFSKKQVLLFSEIDRKFLNAYESYMLRKNKSMTTIGVYTRNLRSLFNEAIAEKNISFELYPFGRNKYQIPHSSNNKRALHVDALKKIIEYIPDGNLWEETAKDYWLFSLYCQGMNMKDIANLKYSNIEDDRIVYTREKTRRTKRTNIRPIVVYMTDEAKDIIRRIGNPDRRKSSYVFPIYKSGNSELRNLRVVEQHLKMVNKYIRIIAAKLDITQDISFYGARHSFATTLKRQGRSIEEIQEFIGHADKRTTELYLASFGDDHKRNIISGFVSDLKKKS